MEEIAVIQAQLTCSSEMAAGFLKTTHSTVSLQGGVVREPL